MRRRRGTLRGRLALSAVGVAAACVVLLTAAFDVVLMHRLHDQATALLHTRAAAALATVTPAAGGSLVISDTEDAAFDSGTWIFRGRTPLERAPGPRPVQQAVEQLVGTSGQELELDRPTPVALYSLPVRVGAQQVGTVIAAISLQPYETSERNIVLASAVLGALLLGLVYPLTRLLVGRALQPVAEMTRAARTWSETGTEQRFGKRDRPGELAELAGTLDDLLDRLSAVLRREQQVTTEISHELRTPLAGILAESELFATQPGTLPEARASLARVAASAQRMTQLLETLLSAARAPHEAHLGRCEAQAVLTATAAATHDPRVHVSAADAVTVGVDGSIVERMLAPLLDNALRYARERVDLSATVDGGQVLLVVADDGPGVADDEREIVFAPGYSRDPSAGRSGLGLALARRLARMAGGDLTCRGTEFVVRLPAG